MGLIAVVELITARFIIVAEGVDITGIVRLAVDELGGVLVGAKVDGSGVIPTISVGVSSLIANPYPVHISEMATSNTANIPVSHF